MERSDLIPTRSSLLAKIKDLADESAWQEFHRLYTDLVRRLALKAGLTESEADDVVQEVFVGVTRNIQGFIYDPTKCSFKSWLSQMVRWRISDQLRKRLPVSQSPGPTCPGGDARALFLETPASSEFDALWEAEWNQHLISLATGRVKSQVSPKQYQVFYLHVLKEMPVREVVQRLKVNRTQVYLAKLRVGRRFREELQKLREQSDPPSV